jgi:transposase
MNGTQEAWSVQDELLPVRRRLVDYSGRKRLEDRKVLSGILFVLHTGISWEHLPQESGFGPGMACRRRLRDWHAAGVWQHLHLYGDRGYDHDKYRRLVWATGVKPVIARRGSGHGSGLGVHRWLIEQTIALPHWFDRLRIRWEIRDDIHEAFMALGAAIICWPRLAR